MPRRLLPSAYPSFPLMQIWAVARINDRNILIRTGLAFNKPI